MDKENIEIFKNDEFGEIRTLQVNDKTMFCGSDVAKALGYVNTKDAIIKHCKEDGVAFCDFIDSLGRKQSLLVRVMSTVLSPIANSHLLKSLSLGFLMRCYLQFKGCP